MTNFFALITVLGLLLAGCSLPEGNQQEPVSSVLTSPDSETIPREVDSQEVDFTAGFEVYTLGTKRIFTNTMYHNLSSNVYIEASDPNVVHVKKTGITWADFFESLPFSLEKDCLVTGTNQTFCTNEVGTLRFFINGNEDSDALDRVIQPNDFLRVSYQK
ncbi:MAG: hypothetical protein WDZ94_05445 [Patescibacteria group bacterium]